MQKKAILGYTGITVGDKTYSLQELYQRAVEKGHVKAGPIGSMINDLEVMVENDVTHVILEYSGRTFTIEEFRANVDRARGELSLN